MMPQAEQFPFMSMSATTGSAGLFPWLPIDLRLPQQSIRVHGLLDTGAVINVLPFDVGIKLGADWDQQNTVVKLGGNLAQHDASAILVDATVSNFPTVRLAFAWARTNAVPLLLGQVNFFMEFDVCFFRSRAVFEVKPK